MHRDSNIQLRIIMYDYFNIRTHILPDIIINSNSQGPHNYIISLCISFTKNEECLLSNRKDSYNLTDANTGSLAPLKGMGLYNCARDEEDKFLRDI